MRRLLLAGLLALAIVLGPIPTAKAQDEPTTTSLVELPPADIIPAPNSGHAPTEAGDRGGALQLGLLALVTVTIAAGVFHVWRQSKRARVADAASPPGSSDPAR